MGLRRHLAAIAALTLCFAAAAGARAPSLDRNLRAALVAPGIAKSAVGAMAIDLETGATVFAQNADTPLQPASNEKIGLAYTALVELGPSYRFRTEVLGNGHRQGRVWRGQLVLKGYGDPTLTTGELDRLAGMVAAQGIRRVTGHVLGDDSWLDSRWSVVGWLPSFVFLESPPLTALVVNRGWRDSRRAADPALAAAALFARALRAHGVAVTGARIGRAGAGATLLARTESETLRRLLTAIDSDSDNFSAEMVLKTIGREVLGRGTTAAGASVVRRDLRAAGVPLAGVRIVDGSGLSREDRVTARALAALLVVMWRDPTLRPIIRGSLAIAGVRGTLRNRLTKAPVRGRVRAKTGTTSIASALSGYAGERYAFAIVQNGNPIPYWYARLAQDRFVTKLAVLATQPSP